MSRHHRVPIHFPHIIADGCHLARCSCGWNGQPHSLDNVGEQLAKEDAIKHSMRRDFFSVSKLVAKPQYAFEVS